MGNLKESYGNSDYSKQKENYDILMYAKDCWDALWKVRKTARYNRNMLHGIQWTAEELQAIQEQGQRPITHNIISQIMANLTGQYLSNKGQPVAVARKRESAMAGKMMSLAIEHVININGDNNQDVKNFTRLATGGVICARVDFGYISEKDRYDVITQNINPHTMFFTPLVDDGTKENLDIIGSICEDSIDGIIVNFAQDEQDAEFIKEIYHYNSEEKNRYVRNRYSMLAEQDSQRVDNLDFLISEDYDKCRYFEIWTKERRLVRRYHDYASGEIGITELNLREIEQINEKRIEECLEVGIAENEAKLIEVEQRWEYVWKYRFVTTEGYVLKEGESPFNHQSHPYIMAFYDVLDGNIHPVVSNITELQREINHLYMQADFMNGNGAKGVLIFDKKMFANSGISMEEVQEGWTAFNTAFGVDIPQGRTLDGLVRQFYTQGNIAPIISLYSQNVSMAQQIIGVNQAIQGQQPQSGTPAARYMQETANAQLNSKPFMQTMTEFQIRKYNKVMKVIQQFYDEQRYMEVVGKENISYREDIADIDFDLSIIQEITTSNYSITEDDKLFQMVLQGLLPVDMYFELSHAGFTKQALELLKQKQQEQMQQQMPQNNMQEQEKTQEQTEIPQEAESKQYNEIVEQAMEQMQQQEIQQPQQEERQTENNLWQQKLLEQLLNK
ncbi:MAG: hypothetical protein Q4Q06_02945 [Bacteroidota bacterium]|nr:hypothetical protein [Bacteroidota bacterium]